MSFLLSIRAGLSASWKRKRNKLDSPATLFHLQLSQSFLCRIFAPLPNEEVEKKASRSKGGEWDSLEWVSVPPSLKMKALPQRRQCHFFSSCPTLAENSTSWLHLCFLSGLLLIEEGISSLSLSCSRSLSCSLSLSLSPSCFFCLQLLALLWSCWENITLPYLWLCSHFHGNQPMAQVSACGFPVGLCKRKGLY